jgi:arylsulfatase A-like enzyme
VTRDRNHDLQPGNGLRAEPFHTRLFRSGAAGLLAGAFVGLVEVVLLVVLGGDPSRLHALSWALVAYGALGLLLGLFVGTALFLLDRDMDRASAYAYVWAGVYFLLGFLVVRYRLYRDLLHEGIRTLSPQGLLFHAGLLLLLGFSALFVVWLWRRPVLRPLTEPRGAGVAFALVIALGAVVSFAFRPGESLATSPEGIPPGLEGTPNVILIGVDTLRADRLSSYGYHSQTPNIDALAGDGVRYTAMTAQASWTKPSFATIFTSLYPSSHTATGKPHRLPQVVTTLAEALSASGYHSGGFADNPSISASFGFDQGFADYVYLEPAYLLGGSEATSQLALYQLLRRGWAMISGEGIYVQNFYQDASVVNQHALDWMEKNKHTRFFLFLHYMDPHDPYFEHPYNGYGHARASDQNPDPSMAPEFSHLYDGEVRYLDEHLGQLFDWLKAEGLYEETLIVLTADHGEEFQEHGGWWHGQTLYQEQINVPLIVKYPVSLGEGSSQASTVSPSLVVDDLVRSLDIAPTILDVAGVYIPEAMVGRSLWSATDPVSLAFSEEDHEGNVLQSVRTPDRKLILANPDNPRGLPAEALFDLNSDPGELRNLASTAPDQIDALRGPLEDLLAFARGQAVAGEIGSLDAAVQERLRDLGY